MAGRGGRGLAAHGVLALAVTAQLRAAAGLSRAKVGFLRSLAEHVVSGELELERLDELDDEAVIAELTAETEPFTTAKMHVDGRGSENVEADKLWREQ